MKSLSPKLTFLALGFVLGIFTSAFVYLGINFKNKFSPPQFTTQHDSHLSDNSMNSKEYDDLQYLNSMIIHHTSALEMADLALRKSNNKFILGLSKNIITTQTSEISDMKSEMENIVNKK